MDEALREQNDRLAIVDVINRYGIAIDAGDWERLASCFTPDAKVSYGSGSEFHGGAEVAEFVKGATVGLTAQQHLLGNHEIAIDGDRATASTYLHATQIQREEAGGSVSVTAASTATPSCARTVAGSSRSTGCTPSGANSARSRPSVC